MRQMKSYTCFLTEKGDVVVVIPFMGTNKPNRSKLLYAGGEHAVFYKTAKEEVILDYINEIIQPILKETKRVLLFEVDVTKQKIMQSYFVPVKHVEKLPDFSLELKAE